MLNNDDAIVLGHPSYVWREGQSRRLGFIQRYASLEGARVLDAGSGLGLYVAQMREAGAETYGVDLDLEKATAVEGCLVASVTGLPYRDGVFDLVLSHEVIEHVDDDALAVREAFRVLKPGGRMVVFCPNRWYPFETHGAFWGGSYHFGNVPLVNYLPNPLRNRFCPHVRAYTRRGLRSLFAELPGRIVEHRCIYAGYDELMERRPRLARFLRRVTYALEPTPLQWFGLSHLLVFEKAT
ncbi:MAG: class I SAM-dependent methyltransferase [Anaerolineae bacterium]|jgi:SAM-dependent methyltransferase